MTRARYKKGFLLLEVMVSIVVITGGLLFIMRVFWTAKEALNKSRAFFAYSLLLEEKIFDFEERGMIEEDKDHGTFPDNKEYSWVVEAESLEMEQQQLGGLCSVDLDVFYGQGSQGGADKYSLWTYLEKKK